MAPTAKPLVYNGGNAVIRARLFAAPYGSVVLHGGYLRARTGLDSVMASQPHAVSNEIG